jgi:hypothetical protein
MKAPPASVLAGGQHGCDTPVLLSSVQSITPDSLPIFGWRQGNCAQESVEHYLLRPPAATDNAAGDCLIRFVKEKPGVDGKICYLNTDLDLTSSDDLTALAAIF